MTFLSAFHRSQWIYCVRPVCTFFRRERSAFNCVSSACLSRCLSSCFFCPADRLGLFLGRGRHVAQEIPIWWPRSWSPMHACQDLTSSRTQQGHNKSSYLKSLTTQECTKSKALWHLWCENAYMCTLLSQEFPNSSLKMRYNSAFVI